ncbi:MAG TPA: Uma2 family endonuclease [Halomicronema sp.]
MNSYKIDLAPVIELTDEQFYELCGQNPDYKFERTAKGELIIMSPTGGETGGKNWSINGQIWLWNQRTSLGIGFDSLTCFKLPNGANLSPNAAWILQERWDALSAEERRKFPPICPDFVIELRSPTDTLKNLREKMVEYKENGARLGWLIDPINKQVEVYRLGVEVEVLEGPASVSGEDVLPGFVLDLAGIL